jgi:hypothetical protein
MDSRILEYPIVEYLKERKEVDSRNIYSILKYLFPELFIKAVF